MRRTFVLALAALALLGVVASEAFAQAPPAPTPTFKITGFIDQVMTYQHNVSNVDANMNHIDTQWYGRTRGRFDIIGQYGKTKAVMGFETDMVYGLAGSNDSTIGNNGGSAIVPVNTQFGTDGSFDLNTDTRAILEIKWLYTEFEMPLIPVPTTVRLGAQPMGSNATYKLSTYAGGDFAGVNIVSVLTPNVRLEWTYLAVEEALVGRSGGQGVSLNQLRGDDWATVIAPEITPFKGLDLKPMISYFYASGTTSGSARQGRGGVNTTTAYTAPDGSWRSGINENRYTVGLDARFRLGGFSLDPSVLYQFGNRRVVVPTGLLASYSGKQPGSVAKADLNAWLMDIRAGYQLGPLLLEAMYMFTTGNSADDTTINNVKYYQPLNTDTGYLADWGSQLTALGIDYLSAMMEAGNPMAYPGVAIGWDKYGRQQVGARATYAFTPGLSSYGGVNVHWTTKSIDQNSTIVSGGGILPSEATFRNKNASNSSNYVGTELFGGATWRFAPGIAWDAAGGYMFVGKALDVTGQGAGSGPIPNAKDAYIVTTRIRFSF